MTTQQLLYPIPTQRTLRDSPGGWTSIWRRLWNGILHRLQVIHTPSTPSTGEDAINTALDLSARWHKLSTFPAITMEDQCPYDGFAQVSPPMQGATISPMLH